MTFLKVTILMLAIASFILSCNYSEYPPTQNSASELSEEKIDSLDLLQKFMDEWKAVPCIPWQYLNDGCFPRAHYGWYLGKEMNLEFDKIWIERNAKGENEKVKLIYKSDTNIQWVSHVALYKEVENTAYVLDGGFFDSPVSVQEWKAVAGYQQGYHRDTILDGRRYGILYNVHVPKYDDDLEETSIKLLNLWRDQMSKIEPADSIWNGQCGLPEKIVTN